MVVSILFVAALGGASLVRVQPALAFQVQPQVRTQPGSVERAARARMQAESSSPAVEGAVPGDLGLLPFSVDEALLPGETKQVHLFEARFLQLFSDASRNGAARPRMAALLVTPGGNAAAVTTLFEVEDWRRKEFGVWAQLKCTGRVQMVDVRQTDYEYLVGNVEPYVDNPVADPESQTAANFLSEAEQLPVGTAERKIQASSELPDPLVEELVRVHDQVAVLYRKLEASNESNSAGETVEWGHELRDAAAEAGSPLEELFESRSAVLKSRGLDALPAPSLRAAVQQWGDLDDATARRQLLSFTAAAALSAETRLQVLQMQDTTERLKFVLRALEQKQQRLAALTALRGVMEE
jgi:Lon protease-like protein